MIGLGTDGVNILCGKHHSLFTFLEKKKTMIDYNCLDMYAIH
jgi:hypothetical protein